MFPELPSEGERAIRQYTHCCGGKLSMSTRRRNMSGQVSVSVSLLFLLNQPSPLVIRRNVAVRKACKHQVHVKLAKISFRDTIEPAASLRSYCTKEIGQFMTGFLGLRMGRGSWRMTSATGDYIMKEVEVFSYITELHQHLRGYNSLMIGYYIYYTKRTMV